jgi:ribosomal-protein-alanine N-acetyltransferase
MDLSLKVLTINDLSEILRIAKSSFSQPWSYNNFLGELERDVSMGLGIFTGKTLLAYAIFWVIKPEAHILNLAVDPLWRRKHIGKLLLNAVINFVKAKETKIIHLEVDETNTSALALYKSMGFFVAGRRKKYYEEERDAILMNLILGGESNSLYVEGMSNG